MSKVVSSTPFIKERRIELGLDSHEVARKAGLSPEVYRQIECRGQLPEAHLRKLAAVLGVTENKLRAEKIAVMAEAMLGIPKYETHGFIARQLMNK